MFRQGFLRLAENGISDRLQVGYINPFSLIHCCILSLVIGGPISHHQAKWFGRPGFRRRLSLDSLIVVGIGKKGNFLEARSISNL